MKGSNVAFWRNGKAPLLATSARYLDIAIDRGRFRTSGSAFNAALRVKGANAFTTYPTWNALQGAGTAQTFVNTMMGAHNQLDGNAGGCWRSLDYMVDVIGAPAPPLILGAFPYPEMLDVVSVQGIIGGDNARLDANSIFGIGLFQSDGTAAGANPTTSNGMWVHVSPTTGAAVVLARSAGSAGVVKSVLDGFSKGPTARVEIRAYSARGSSDFTQQYPTWEVYVNGTLIYRGNGSNSGSTGPASLSVGKCGYQMVIGNYGPGALMGQYVEVYDARLILAQVATFDNPRAG